MHWATAILVTSLLSAALAAFTYAQLLFPRLYWSLFPRAFLLYGAAFLLVCGISYGVWCLRFRAVLPLILAHAVVNGTILAPHLLSEYRIAAAGYPKCHRIDLLAMDRPETAIPVLVELMADCDPVVSAHAMDTLLGTFRGSAAPYLKLRWRRTTAGPSRGRCLLLTNIGTQRSRPTCERSRGRLRISGSNWPPRWQWMAWATVRG